MQRVLGFSVVERHGLGVAKIVRRRRVERISRGQVEMLDSSAVGEIGSWKEADGLLPISGNGLLRQVVHVNRRRAVKRATILVEDRVIEIDAGQNVRGHSEHDILDTETG